MTTGCGGASSWGSSSACDLYVMGDLSKREYVLRRQALEEELSRTRPPFDPRLDRAEELLGDFGRIWSLEDDPAKRRRLLATLFDSVWQDAGTIVAVKPREAFLRYSKRPTKWRGAAKRSAVSKAGATGLEPATSGVTGRRSNQLNYAPKGTPSVASTLLGS